MDCNDTYPPTTKDTMFVNSNLVRVIGYVVVYQAMSLRHYKKSAKHYEQYSRELHADLDYLCHRMNEMNIELDEFDLIVLNHVSKRSEDKEGC